MKQLLVATLLAGVLPLMACTKDDFDNSTVSEFDLSRYLGVWYEIARFDHSFERGMDNAMAQYILQDDGTVVVLNTGWKEGQFKIAEGKAKYPDPEKKPGALKVSFFMFFYADYNILEMAADGSWVLVGGGSPKYLWILAREKQLPTAVIDHIIKLARERGYDTDALIFDAD